MAEREFACAPDGSFDVVILVDVFEHFLSPTSLLSRLISLIKPGGLLIIVTGNGDNAFCRLDPAQFWYFRNIEHIIMLTRRYAESLAHHFRLTLGQYEIATHYDASWWRKIVQFTQHFAYWQFRKRNHFIAKLFRLFPEIRKAERWPVAPGFSGSKDHVIAVFEKHDCSE